MCCTLDCDQSDAMKYILAIKNNKSKNYISEMKENVSKHQLRSCFRQGFKASP